MTELAKIVNIGKILERQLNEAGIKNHEELVQVGSRNAWLKIRLADSSACYNRLCALEGAVQNLRWHDLSEKDKNELKDFYRQWK